ncbi:hypothetical protein SAMD00019534_096280 [Acytostelium subglobosum LB1]|uniref:hypothetical protein n=1 Tax=Acytostelium subglobosum LB1 TaxID=1410327 RepID=UPI0006451A28|nr:hypothetical protein SAMD00019534_096280 [Acytostelium subglobosum LB1]GAM26453.1 hypothetical protein SAMD00019534_096280 [Acytostelium subglobosum LB1]|eukprot:XP_012750549.1 hypothetical protein SAMD00019534_096280 [Acytostelium subglobosum LB1]
MTQSLRAVFRDKPLMRLIWYHALRISIKQLVRRQATKKSNVQPDQLCDLFPCLLSNVKRYRNITSIDWLLENNYTSLLVLKLKRREPLAWTFNSLRLVAFRMFDRDTLQLIVDTYGAREIFTGEGSSDIIECCCRYNNLSLLELYVRDGLPQRKFDVSSLYRIAAARGNLPLLQCLESTGLRVDDISALYIGMIESTSAQVVDYIHANIDRLVVQQSPPKPRSGVARLVGGLVGSDSSSSSANQQPSKDKYRADLRAKASTLMSTDFKTINEAHLYYLVSIGKVFHKRQHQQHSSPAELVAQYRQQVCQDLGETPPLALDYLAMLNMLVAQGWKSEMHHADFQIARMHNISITRYAMKTLLNKASQTSILHSMLRKGTLEQLQYVLQNIGPIKQNNYQMDYILAATANESPAVVQYAYDMFNSFFGVGNSAQQQDNYNSLWLNSIIGSSNIECVRYLMTRKVAPKAIHIRRALEVHNIDILILLFEKVPMLAYEELCVNKLYYSFVAEHFVTLHQRFLAQCQAKAAAKMDVQLDLQSLANVSSYFGLDDTLRYIHETVDPTLTISTKYAARTGQFATLEYLAASEMGVFDEDTWKTVATLGDVNVFRRLYQSQMKRTKMESKEACVDLLSMAYLLGRVDLIQMTYVADQRHLHPTLDVLIETMNNGHVNMIQYFLAHHSSAIYIVEQLREYARQHHLTDMIALFQTTKRRACSK